MELFIINIGLRNWPFKILTVAVEKLENECRVAVDDCVKYMAIIDAIENEHDIAGLPLPMFEF